MSESEFVAAHSKRVSEIVATVMNVIRMIKLFGWEPKVRKQIAEKRDEELIYIRNRQLLDLLNGTIK